YEFQPYGHGTLFDLLMAETKPNFVRYEMDVFWIVHPGQDPVKLLQKYGKRFELMHVKDMKKGTPTGLLTGHSDVTNDVALGTGIMDWPAILRAAKKAGVKWYFIEDESPTSVEQIPRSLRFLEQVKSYFSHRASVHSSRHTAMAPVNALLALPQPPPARGQWWA